MSEKLVFTIDVNSQQAEQAVRQLHAAMSSLSKAGSGSFAGAAAGAGPAVAAIGAVTAAAAAAAAALAGLGFAFKKGLDVNAELETATLGIKGIIASVQDVRNAAGEPAKGMERLNIAGAEAERQLKLLRVAGMQTSAEFVDLAKAFQTALGAGSTAGLGVDQIRELTVSLTIAAGAFNLAGDQLSSEIRAVLSGNEIDNSQIAQGLSITGAQVKLWREQGTLVDELNKRLENFKLLGEESGRSWSATMSNLGDAISIFLGTATKGAFDELKTSLQSAMKAAINPDTGEVNDKFRGVADLATQVFGDVGDALADAIDGGIALAQDLSAWFDKNREAVTGVWNAVKAVVASIADAVNMVASFVAGIVGATAKTGALQASLEFVALLVAGVADGFRVVAGVVGTIGAVIVASLLQPLTFVAGLIDKIAGTNFAAMADKIKSAAVAFGSLAAAQAKAGLAGTSVKAAEKRIQAGSVPQASYSNEGRGQSKTTTPAGAGGTVKAPKPAKAPSTGGSKKGADDAKRAAERLQQSLEDLERALEEADKKRFESRQDMLRAQLDQEVALHLKSKRGEIDARLALDKEANAAEQALAAKRRKALADKLAAETDPAKANKLRADIAKADADVDALLAKNKTLEIRASIDTAKLEEQVKELRQQLAGDIADATGNIDYSLDRLRQEREKLLKDEKVIGDPATADLVNKSFDLKEQNARFDNAETRLSNLQAQVANGEKAIELAYEDGAITLFEREDKLKALRADNLKLMRAQVDEMLKLAEASGNPKLMQAAQAASNALAEVNLSLTQTTRDALKDMRADFTAAFKDVLSGAQSFGDALRNVLVKALTGIADRYLTNAMDGVFAGFQKLLKAGSGSAGGGFDWGALLSAGASMLGFATGGQVRGPGTGTSDSILARLSNGEFVVRAAAVRDNLDVLKYLNRTGRMPAFASGSLVGSLGGLGGSTTVQNAVNVSPRVNIHVDDIVDALSQSRRFEAMHTRLTIDNGGRIKGSW